MVQDQSQSTDGEAGKPSRTKTSRLKRFWARQKEEQAKLKEARLQRQLERQRAKRIAQGLPPDPLPKIDHRRGEKELQVNRRVGGIWTNPVTPQQVADNEALMLERLAEVRDRLGLVNDGYYAFNSVHGDAAALCGLLTRSDDD